MTAHASFFELFLWQGVTYQSLIYTCINCKYIAQIRKGFVNLQKPGHWPSSISACFFTAPSFLSLASISKMGMPIFSGSFSNSMLRPTVMAFRIKQVPFHSKSSLSFAGRWFGSVDQWLFAGALGHMQTGPVYAVISVVEANMVI